MPREHVDPDVFLARLTACFPSSSTVVPASAAPPAGGRSKGKKSAAATAGDGNASARTAGAPSQPQDDVQVERKGGSVWLTHKRYTHGRSAAATSSGDVDMDAPTSSQERDWDVLIRCTDGVDVSFSTRIPASRLPSFHAAYGSLLKGCFAPHMRKRDKKKDKLKLERREARRKELERDVDLGRLDKRRRAMERAKRQEATGGEPGAVAQVEKVKRGEKGEDGRAKIRRVGHRQRKRILAAQAKKEAQRARLQRSEQQQGKKA